MSSVFPSSPSGDVFELSGIRLSSKRTLTIRSINSAGSRSGGVSVGVDSTTESVDSFRLMMVDISTGEDRVEFGSAKLVCEVCRVESGEERQVIGGGSGR